MSLLLLFNQSAASGASGTAFQSFVEAGMFLGIWRLDDYLTFTACIHDDTGAAADADTVPSYAIYEDETATAIVTGDMAKLGAVDGFYTERVQLTAANGFENSKCYAIRIAATVGAIPAAATHVFQVGGGGLTEQETADAVHNLAPTGTPAAGSIGDHLYDLATALAAATSTLTIVSAVDGDVLTIYQAVSLSATISGLSIPAAWTKLWFTVKQSSTQADADAIIQMIETNPGAGTDGLLRLNGAAGTAASGALTVSQAAGTVAIALLATATDDLALATGLAWSLKALTTAGETTLLAVGTLNVLAQATAAVA